MVDQNFVNFLAEGTLHNMQTHINSLRNTGREDLADMLVTAVWARIAVLTAQGV